MKNDLSVVYLPNIILYEGIINYLVFMGQLGGARVIRPDNINSSGLHSNNLIDLEYLEISM